MAAISTDHVRPMGASLLASDRLPQVRSLEELATVAEAIEAQAIIRYREMARTTARKGQTETARTFLRLSAEAEARAAALRRPGRSARDAPDLQDWMESLPPDFATSWEDVRDSALLTPYRALAIAVTNEQRAFALYSYLAAQASDPALAKEAERLAHTKLQHAEELRRWRRAAYRDDAAARVDDRSTDPAPPATWIPATEREIAIRHRDAADALAAAGDEESAALLRAGSLLPFDSLPGSAPGDLARSSDDPIRLLTAAQKPLEQFVERLEAALDREPDETAFREAQAHLEAAVIQLGTIKRRVADLARLEIARTHADEAQTALR